MADSAARGTGCGDGANNNRNSDNNSNRTTSGRFSMVPVNQPPMVSYSTGVGDDDGGKVCVGTEVRPDDPGLEEAGRLLLQGGTISPADDATGSPVMMEELDDSSDHTFSVPSIVGHDENGSGNNRSSGAAPLLAATGGDPENGTLTRNEAALVVSVIGGSDTGDAAGGGGGGTNDSSYNSTRNRRKNFRCGLYARLLKLFEVSKKSERAFMVLGGICFALLLIVIVLAFCWPHIPDYLRMEVCMETDCFEASKQILTSAQPNVVACDEPYQWACGRFEEHFRTHAFREIYKGEWSPIAQHDYQRTLEAFQFIVQLPMTAMTYSAQRMIYTLYQRCSRLETGTDREGLNALRHILLDLGGWQVINEDRRHYWDLRENLRRVQPMYGAAPFFKLGVDTRNEPPYDYMITVTEGTLGLPSMEFYNLKESHPIIQAYHTLLINILSHMVVTSTENAQEFASKIYNYEKRIASSVMRAVRFEKFYHTHPQVQTLHQIGVVAPSLPIMEAAQAMFKGKKITENTPVMVSSPGTLRAISQVVATSDKEVLNDYFIWTVIWHFAPFVSREFRVSVHQFERAVHGAREREPMWYFCANLVRQWMPYGLQALRENTSLIVQEQRSSASGTLLPDKPLLQPILRSKRQQSPPYQHQHQQQQQQQQQGHASNLPLDSFEIGGTLNSNDAGDGSAGIEPDTLYDYQMTERISYDDELVKLIFYHLRGEYRRALENAPWVYEELARYLIDKLDTLRVQIGLPPELLRSELLLNDYYEQLVLDGLLFINNVKNQWDFTKRQMNRMLDNQTEAERILAEMYPALSSGELLRVQMQQGRNHDHHRTPLVDPLVRYSIGLNMVIVSRQRIQPPYFSHHYPISVNFARFGMDISYVLQMTLHTLTDQFRNVVAHEKDRDGANPGPKPENVFYGEAQKCMVRAFNYVPFIGRTMNETRLNLYLKLSAVGIASQAFGSLLAKLERNERIYESDISEKTTYEMLGLDRHRRLPGLQPYDEHQLFTLVFFQRHCSINHDKHKVPKLLMENDITEHDRFHFFWNRIASFGSSFDCKTEDYGDDAGDGVTKGRCSNVL
ncbi:protein gone early [Anopheles bellator]|uniref:protein gone early n=1 Tax=Anopheles bellator TaxID=139047 RepID=UPI002647C00F|nr:protein gone early [Anopheles bellator]